MSQSPTYSTHFSFISPSTLTLPILLEPSLSHQETLAAAETLSDLSSSHSYSGLSSRDMYEPSQRVHSCIIQPTQVSSTQVHYHYRNGEHKHYHNENHHSRSSMSLTRQKRRKPPKSYVILIAEAILSSATQRLSIREIYAAIAAAYPNHYNNPMDVGWQNTVRYNLSRHPAFVKVSPTTDITGSVGVNTPPSLVNVRASYWTIADEYIDILLSEEDLVVRDYHNHQNHHYNHHRRPNNPSPDRPVSPSTPRSLSIPSPHLGLGVDIPPASSSIPTFHVNKMALSYLLCS